MMMTDLGSINAGNGKEEKREKKKKEVFTCVSTSSCNIFPKN